MTYYDFAQKFTTPNVTGGVRIQVDQTNPGDGKGTVPISVELNLFQWDTNYATTIAGTKLVRERVIIPSEETEDDLMWIYLLWKPLPPGTYLWQLHVFNSINPATGTFQIRRDTTSTYHDAFVEGISQSYDFYSQIMGLDAETYEFVLSLGDAFDSYQTSEGHSGTKINRGSTGTPEYANSIRSQDPVTDGSRKIGRIASGSLVKTS